MTCQLKEGAKMKTKIEQSDSKLSGVYGRLHEAIKIHSGLDDSEMMDAGKHGADSGWAGFTYYTDTGEFFKNNSEDIFELLAETADQMGEKNLFSLMAGFGQAKNANSYETFANLLAWFALEEVGRELERMKEEGK